MWSLLSLLVAIIISCFALGVVTKKIIVSLDRLSRSIGLSHFALTTMVVSLATSLPELTVAISSSAKGIPSLAFGNAIGANMANLSLVMGTTAIVAHSIYFYHQNHSPKLFYPLVFTFFPFLFSFDGSISRLEGLCLIAFYFIFLKTAIHSSSQTNQENKPPSVRSFRSLPGLLFWMFCLVILAQIIVRLAQLLSARLDLPVALVGIFVVSIGTTLPELIFNLRALKLNHPSMATANIIGSCLFNANFILGLSAVIHPIVFNPPSLVFLPAVEYFFASLVFVYFVSTKRRLDAWEGGVLLVLFLYYAVIELVFK